MVSSSLSKNSVLPQAITPTNIVNEGISEGSYI